MQLTIEPALLVLTAQLTVEPALLVITMLVFGIVFAAVFALAVYLVIKVNRLEKKQKEFLKGSDGKSLENSLLFRYKEIDGIQSELRFINEKLNVACETLITSYQKVGIVKYNAFSEMGGKLSFSLCMLDDEDSGFILTSIYSNEGCYLYMKEIIKGEAYVLLSEEERSALDEAKNKKNLYAEV